MSKTLVPRYEVLGVRLKNEPAIVSHQYEGTVDGMTIRVMTLRYPTRLDARLGAQGLRVVGYTILGIRDLRTGDLVDATCPKRDEL